MKAILIGLSLLLVPVLFSQQGSSANASSRPYPIPGLGNNGFARDIFGSMGIFAGQEHFIALKGSLIKPINFGYRWRQAPKYGFYPHGAYASLEGSLFGLFALWGGAGINIGYNIGPVTIDNSLTAWGIIGENNSFGLTSYNPKIGLHFGPVWLKAGPSFRLSKHDFIENFLCTGDYHLNFELSFLVCE